MGDKETASLSDIATIVRNNDGFGGSNAILYLLLFIIICWGGGGFGFGNRGPAPQNSQSVTDAVIAANGGYVTSEQMGNVLRLQEIQQGQSAITSNVNAVEQRLTAVLGDLKANQQTNAQAQQACCNDLKYTGALNASEIKETSTANMQKVLDRLNQMEMSQLQRDNEKKDAEIAQLKTQQYVDQQLNPIRQGVFMTTKYPNPNTFSYSAGQNPFCACGTCPNM